MKIRKMSDSVYLLNDNDSGTAYVVVGSERALVIDTCNGFENFLDIVRSITDKPLVLVNTHAHPDHVRGNVWFEKAYINFRDKEQYYDMFKGEMLPPAIRGLAPCAIENIDDGDKIDLGDREIEVIAFPGHTAGGICLLSRADRVLFTGDSILGRTLWMFMPTSVTLSRLVESLENVKRYSDGFDWLLTGHGIGYDTPELIDRIMEAAKSVIENRAERYGEVALWGGSQKCVYYVGENDKEATLVYREDLAR
jgi:glyoxylase-like metal-dependent hydrolase (beta-lactamase superfamily II)